MRAFKGLPMAVMRLEGVLCAKELSIGWWRGRHLTVTAGCSKSFRQPTNGTGRAWKGRGYRESVFNRI